MPDAAESRSLIALLIFGTTYVVLALGRFPGLRVDRTGASIIGAGLMIGAGVLTFDEAMGAVDHATLVLLFGMMVIVANLRLSGFFRAVSAWVVRRAHQPKQLLAGVVAVAGVLSAFFVNDTMCIVLTPLVLEVTRTLRRNPVPYLLAVAMASNAGSVATITGNPQNMLIGSLSKISYRAFAAELAPVALISLGVVYVMILSVYREEFRSQRLEVSEVPLRVHKALLWKSFGVAVLIVVLFFSGVGVASASMIGAAILLITRRVKPAKVYADVDWQLLALFAGLFIVVAGVERTSIEREFFSYAARFGLDRLAVLSLFSALLSNLVSNVPAVLVFRPVVAKLARPEAGWLALAMSSTLAGNFTILGSVANLIVVERASPRVKITFGEYFRVGAPVTIVTLILGILWLSR